MEQNPFSTRTLFWMSWPIFIELMLQLLVGNIDQLMLSRFNSTAVAAVGNANQIITVVLLTFNVTSLAATIMISQYRGAQDERSVEQIYTLSLSVNLVLSLVLAVGLIAFAGPPTACCSCPPSCCPRPPPTWSSPPCRCQ